MNMKIATWNTDRLKTKKKLNSVVESIQEIDADILILTEYNSILELPFYKYKIATEKLLESPYDYKETERRVAIFSNFPINKIFKTYDDQTSCCAEFKTDFGDLIVYGTVVGIVGNTDPNFKTDLIKQTEDVANISKLGNFCYAGDLNISFSDNYYFTRFGREKFLECFKNNLLKNLTESVPENIDHIILTESFTQGFNYEISEWNIDKILSDHKGICIEMKNPII